MKINNVILLILFFTAAGTACAQENKYKISVETNYPLWSIENQKTGFGNILSHRSAGTSLKNIISLNKDGLLQQASIIDKMSIFSLKTTGIQYNNGNVINETAYSGKWWDEIIVPEFKKIRGSAAYNLNSLSSYDINLMLEIAKRNSIDISGQDITDSMFVTQIFSAQNNDELNRTVKNISGSLENDEAFLRFASNIEDAAYSVYCDTGLDKEDFDAVKVIQSAARGDKNSGYVCRHFARLSQEILERSGRFPHTYINGRANHTETLVKMNNGALANVSAGTIVRSPRGTMQQVYDVPEAYINNNIYGAGGKPLMVFESSYGQLLRKAFDDTPLDPLYCPAAAPENLTLRVNGSSMLVGQTAAGVNTVIMVLGQKKDLGNFKFSYGAFASYSATNNRNNYSYGVRGAVKYSSDFAEIYKNVRARIDGRAELTAMLRKTDPDASLTVEIKPVAEITNVCGGTLSLELAAQAVPIFKNIARENIGQIRPFINAAWAGAGYEKEKNGTTYFSHITVGTIAKSAFIRADGGIKQKLENDDELVVLIGHITPVGKYDPLLEPAAKTYGTIQYNKNNLQLDLSLYKDMIIYENPAAPNIPQITVGIKINL